MDRPRPRGRFYHILMPEAIRHYDWPGFLGPYPGSGVPPWGHVHAARSILSDDHTATNDSTSCAIIAAS